MKLEKEIIKKWSPYVDKHLNIKNIHFNYLCCHYLDFLQKGNQDIGKKIIEFKDKISSMETFRFEIEKEYFNLLTGRKEYLLSDGSIVDPDNFVEFLSINDLVDIFGMEFLNKFDLEESRNYKLDEILNEDR